MTDLIESDDELLDPQPAPGGYRRARLTALARRLRPGARYGIPGDEPEADPRRRQRVLQAGALALALAAGAGAAGVAVHKADLHRDQSQIQDRLLLHMLGGGASLTYAGVGARDGVSLPDSFDDPMPTDLTIGLRNDGARPLEITGVRIRQPGVDVVDPAPKAVVKPGESVALTTRIAVRCTAADLPSAPTGATLTVRTAADRGQAAGAATDVPLTFTAATPGATKAAGISGPVEALQGSGLGQAYLIGSYVTDSFYQLCGGVLAKMPVGITTGTPSTDASPQNPVVRYTLHVAGTPGAAQEVTTLTGTTAVAGVSAQTDLTGPRSIGASGVDVTVTERITDCAAFGQFLAVHDGANSAAMWLSYAAPVAVQATDPKFRVPGVSGTGLAEMDALTSSGSEAQDALLDQVAAACPAL